MVSEQPPREESFSLLRWSPVHIPRQSKGMGCFPLSSHCCTPRAWCWKTWGLRPQRRLTHGGWLFAGQIFPAGLHQGGGWFSTSGLSWVCSSAAGCRHRAGFLLLQGQLGCFPYCSSLKPSFPAKSQRLKALLA